MHKKNIVYKILSYGLITLLSLLMVPLLVNNVGVELYGVIGFINNIINYISIVTIAFTSVFARNLIFALNKSNISRAKIEYSTTICVLAILSIAILSIVLANKDTILELINIPSEHLDSAFLLLLSILVSFIISMFSSIYGGVYLYKNRLDLQSISTILHKISHFVILALFILIDWNAIEGYALGFLLASVSAYIFNYVNFRRKLSVIKLSFSNVNFMALKGNLKLSHWMIINQVGSLLLIQIVIYFIGKYIGYYQLGLFSISLVIVTQIRTIASLISSLFEPTVYSLISSGKEQKSKLVLNLSILSVGTITAFVTGVFIGSASYFLYVWLGHYDNELVNICIISVIYIPVSVMMTPCWSYLMAQKDVRLNGLVTLIFGAINLLILIFLTYIEVLSLYNAIIVLSVILILKNAIFLPFYLSVIYDFKYRHFGLLFGCVLLVYLFSYLWSTMVFNQISPSNPITVIVSYLIVVLGALVTAYMLKKSLLNINSFVLSLKIMATNRF